jgi:hypothetical protein
VIALIKQCVQLGIHLRVWKTAQGILLRKLDKSDYTQIKAYQVISLLNCLGKVVEKVVADMIAAYCEAAEVLHTGQMGSQRRWSALDTVGCLVQGVHNAWAQRQLAGALFMDVKGAFDHVAAARLIEWMIELGVD